MLQHNVKYEKNTIRLRWTYQLAPCQEKDRSGLMAVRSYIFQLLDALQEERSRGNSCGVQVLLALVLEAPAAW